VLVVPVIEGVMVVTLPLIQQLLMEEVVAVVLIPIPVKTVVQAVGPPITKLMPYRAMEFPDKAMMEDRATLTFRLEEAVVVKPKLVLQTKLGTEEMEAMPGLLGLQQLLQVIMVIMLGAVALEAGSIPIKAHILLLEG